MAVAISQTADPAGVATSSNVATYTGLSIGTAADDRIVALVVSAESGGGSINSATIDYGTGAVAMSASTQGNNASVYARIFYASAPTGTTATFRVTFGASTLANQNHVTAYKITGAGSSPTTGGDGSTDMDVTDPLTTGSITIPTNGGFLAVAAGASDSDTKTWANATEDLDVDAGLFRHTTATSTTGGTVTVTCTGGTNGEDGAMSWAIFTPGYSVAAAAGSYALSGTAAALERGRIVTAAAGSYAFTGTAATLKKGLKLSAASGAYTLTGTAASLERTIEVNADAGSYELTGSAATLIHVTGLVITADAGSYTLAGTDAALEFGRDVNADAGSYSLAGTDATLRITVAGTITAEAGSYSLTGTNATLVHVIPARLTAGAGSYALTGAVASLAIARIPSVLGSGGQRKSVRQPQGPEAGFIFARQVEKRPEVDILALLEAEAAARTAAIARRDADDDEHVEMMLFQ